MDVQEFWNELPLRVVSRQMQEFLYSIIQELEEQKEIDNLWIDLGGEG